MELVFHTPYSPQPNPNDSRRQQRDTPCVTLARSASEGKSLHLPRLRFGRVLGDESSGLGRGVDTGIWISRQSTVDSTAACLARLAGRPLGCESFIRAFQLVLCPLGGVQPWEPVPDFDRVTLRKRRFVAWLGPDGFGLRRQSRFWQVDVASHPRRRPRKRPRLRPRQLRPRQLRPRLPQPRPTYQRSPRLPLR